MPSSIKVANSSIPPKNSSSRITKKKSGFVNSIKNLFSCTRKQINNGECSGSGSGSPGNGSPVSNKRAGSDSPGSGSPGSGVKRVNNSGSGSGSPGSGVKRVNSSGRISELAEALNAETNNNKNKLTREVKQFSNEVQQVSNIFSRRIYPNMPTNEELLAELEELETETDTETEPEPENKVQQATKLKTDLRTQIQKLKVDIEKFITEYTKHKEHKEHKESFENNKLMKTKIKQEVDKKTTDKTQARKKLKTLSTEYLLLINEKKTLLNTIKKINDLFAIIIHTKTKLTNIMQSINLPNTETETLFGKINRDIDNIKIQSINDFKNEILTEIKEFRNEIEIEKAIAESFLNEQNAQRKNAAITIRNLDRMLSGVKAIQQSRSRK